MATIGIDLGTTNSLVAVWKDKKATLIPNSLDEFLTPSVVSVDENGQLLIGKIAKERFITHPELTAANFKRFMGTKKEFSLGNYKFTPEELSSFILKSLKEDAEQYLNEEVTEAVISVPAYFNDKQRKATKNAAELAGLYVERLISEPTAAALAYGLNETNDDTQFLIFDLGGGTFDISILEFFDDVMEVKSIAGDNFLGGEDFNKCLSSYFLNKFNLSLFSLDSKTVSALYKQAEICKRNLTNNQTAKMKLNYNNEELELEISRIDFEKLCNSLIERLRKPIIRALNDADLSPDELDAVILIGGSTRMPLVKSCVTKLFHKLPFTNINPDEAVALGAAIQAALKERNSDLKEKILTDVCPYTLGIEVVKDLGTNSSSSGYFSPIIERNTPIPFSKVETFVPSTKNQKNVRVQIYQGENRMVKDNLKLGELNLTMPYTENGLPTFDVRFTYDINGILEVETTIKKTGQKQSLVIQNLDSTLSDEEIKNRLAKLKEIKIHPRDQAKNRLLIAKGERLYQECTGELREYIANILAQFDAALDSQNPKVINEAYMKLNEILNSIEMELN